MKRINQDLGDRILLNGLTVNENNLYKYMSDLSEEAYCAEWNVGLEYSLWDAMNGKKEKIGRLMITDEIKIHLKFLSDLARGWIVRDKKKGKIIFVKKESWINNYLN